MGTSRSDLSSLIIEELRRLHEGVLARYGLRPSQFKHWKEVLNSHERRKIACVALEHEKGSSKLFFTVNYGTALMLTDSAKQTIINALKQAFAGQLQGILLYGSRASGKAHKQSDYDIGVLLYNPASADILWEVAQDLACQLKQDVDLIDLKSATTVLQKEATVNGLWLLKLDPYACDFFDTYVLSMYQELQENRQTVINNVLNGINNG